jgi:GntR family transcriptional regulator
VYPTTRNESLRAVNCSERDAEALKVDTGTALMEAVRESRDLNGELIEAVRARYLGSQYLYNVHLAAGAANATPAGGGRLFADSLPS